VLRGRLHRWIRAHVGARSARPDLVAVYLRWFWWRALLHRGWWLVTSVYLVVDAHLSPSQLVLIGVAQGLVALVFEVPAGVLADTIGRKWSLLVSHALMGTAMLTTGLVTDFAALVATQMLWGLSWTFASGADVAWITDELDEPERISGVLVRAGRADLTGAAAGIVVLGTLGSLVPRSSVLVLAGGAMLALGLYVALRFREERFVPAPARRWSASWAIFRRGASLVRGSRAILVVFAATFLVNGAAVGIGRMQPRRLVDLGLPTDPVAWFAVLGVLTLLVGAAALRIVEREIDDARAALRGYALACAAGTVGALVLAAAPEEVSASAAVLLVAGLAIPLTRTIGTIWVNRRTSGEVRATVHSLLAQAEYLGEIACGLGIAVLASVAGLSPALLACSALFALAMVLIRRPDAEERRFGRTDKEA
jgi:MFS transporter, DHA3 family, tetracycline resistance protein